MAQEQGTARIDNGIGEIHTASPPQPVAFAPTSFPAIVNNMPVLFERASPGSSLASSVLPAPGFGTDRRVGSSSDAASRFSVHVLTARAEPKSGLTHPARKLMVSTAEAFVVEASEALSVADGLQIFEAAKQKMSAVGALQGFGDAPVGIGAVRKVIG